MYCKSCGKLIDDNSTICPECGTNLNDNTPKKHRIIPYIIIFILTLIIVLIVSVYASYSLTKNSTNENFAQTLPEYADNNLTENSEVNKTDTENSETDKLRKDALAYAESFFDEDFGSSDIGMLEEDLFLISIYWLDGDWACSIEAEIGSSEFEIHEISNRLDESIKEKERIKKQESIKAKEENKSKKEEENNKTDKKGSDNSYLYPSDKKLLTDEFLSTLSKSEIALLRNEIYARHGYIFNSEEYNDYFSKKSWYTPNSNFDTSDLSELEIKNKDLIIAYEEKQGWR